MGNCAKKYEDDIRKLSDLLYGFAIGLTDKAGNFDEPTLIGIAATHIYEEGDESLMNYKADPQLLLSHLKIAKDMLVSENRIVYNPAKDSSFVALGPAVPGTGGNGYEIGSGFSPRGFQPRN